MISDLLEVSITTVTAKPGSGSAPVQPLVPAFSFLLAVPDSLAGEFDLGYGIIDDAQPKPEPSESSSSYQKAIPSYELLPLAVVVFRSSLDIVEQREVLEDVLTKLKHEQKMFSLSLGLHPSPTTGFAYRYRESGYYPLTQPPSCIPLAAERYKKFVEENSSWIFQHNSQESKKELQLPFTFNSYSLWARAYQEDHKLGFHVDPPGDDYVWSLNIGRAATFSYFDKDDHSQVHLSIAEAPENAMSIHLESGDAVLFNGSHLFHGVTQVHGPETAPKDDTMRELFRKHDFVRIGLQMREKTHEVPGLTISSMTDKMSPEIIPKDAIGAV